MMSPIGKRPTRSCSKIKIAALRSGGKRKGFVNKSVRSAKSNRHTPAHG